MEKIKVLLVDDDRIILDDIQGIVDWNALGFEIVGKALNGKKAWDLFQALSPHIVITDICMPIMDGLELSEKIRNVSLRTKILLLTSYEDFDYAKRAFQHNISNYYLKNDLHNESFLKELNKLREQLINEDRLSKQDMQQKFNDIFDDKNHATLCLADSHLNKKKYYILIDFKLPVHQYLAHTKSNPLLTEVGYLGEEIFPNMLIENQYFINDYRILLGVMPRSKAKPSNFLNTAARMIQEHFLREKHLHTDIILDRKQISVIEYAKYYQSIKNNNVMFFQAGDKIVWLEDIQVLFSSKNPCIDTDFYNVYSAFEKGNINEMYASLELLLTSIFDSYDRNSLLTLASDVYSLLDKFWQKQSAEKDFMIPKNILDPEGIANWIYLSFYNASEYKSIININHYSAPVADALAYIDKHYHEPDLTINRIASVICMSEGRLSVIFKNEVDHTINEYITSLRIKKAQYLIQYTNLKIYTIAEIVGYNSSQYFSQVFISATGKKPMDYRKKIF